MGKMGRKTQPQIPHSESPNPNFSIRNPQSAIRNPGEEEPPPVFGSWRALYAVVLGELALCIVLFYLFGRAFS
jgi:hypothetical protein